MPTSSEPPGLGSGAKGDENAMSHEPNYPSAPAGIKTNHAGETIRLVLTEVRKL